MQTDRDVLQDAWRALAGDGFGDGWRTIPIRRDGRFAMLAGRRFPEDVEALLISVGGRVPLAGRQLPRGKGFRVDLVRHAVAGEGDEWICLSREKAGNVEMFARMVEDVANVLEAAGGAGAEELFDRFVRRVAAWQSFMERGQDPVLGPDAEVGLFGELLVMEAMLAIGFAPADALAAWQGPLDGLHDFVFGQGAIEVKCTASDDGFVVTAGSLEQLDPRLAHPLYLAGVRLRPDATGRSLPDVVESVRRRVDDNVAARAVLDTLLLRAGYVDAFAGRYSRRFDDERPLVIPVTDSLPVLTRDRVEAAIVQARYLLDLGRIGAGSVGLELAFEKLGVTSNGA
ncbi:MAG: PD-(D/E)XK motif protein [Nitrospirae bacterium]|nr:PD-(D/E)XK motif protein [Nitrospirota bacterium]